MKRRESFEYNSALAPFITALIEEKRRLGFSFCLQAYNLSRLDKYWLEHGESEALITKERIGGWMEFFEGEGENSHYSRVMALITLSTYMNARGIKCYIPLRPPTPPRVVVHVLDASERAQFFREVDAYEPLTKREPDWRMARGYPVIFRLLYCCGMRASEVCNLKTQDIDLTSGVITIWKGKGHKDRLVYLPDDLMLLCKEYLAYMTTSLGRLPYWFFPGRNPDKPIFQTTLNYRFDQFWNNTEASKHCERKPTPHCLRHSFVVDRINAWVLAGYDRDVMIYYLSKFLGHSYLVPNVSDAI